MAKICLAADTIYSSAVLCFSTQGRADGHLLLVKYWVGLSTSYEPKSKTRAVPLSGRFCQKLVSRSFSHDPWSAWWNEAVVSEPYLPWVNFNDRPKFWQHVFRQFSSLFLLSLSLCICLCLILPPGEVMRTWMFSYLCDRHLHPPVWWPPSVPFCIFSANHPSLHPPLGDKSRKAVLYSTFNSTSMNQSLAAAARDTFSCFTLGALW